MERLLLILDLDETLIHAASPALPREADFETDAYYVYKRPHLDTFLKTVFERYRVAIWTASSQMYAAAVVDEIMPADSSLEFMWTREQCTVRFDPEFREEYYIKNLAKLRRRGHSLERVLVVDDTARKHERNYGNLVEVSPFEGADDDDELLALLSYLRTVESEPNLRSIEKRGWRSRLGDRR